MRRARPRMSRDAPLLYALCKGSFRVRRSLDQHSDLVRSRWNLRIVGVLGQANVFFLAGEGFTAARISELRFRRHSNRTHSGIERRKLTHLEILLGTVLLAGRAGIRSRSWGRLINARFAMRMASATEWWEGRSAGDTGPLPLNEDLVIARRCGSCVYLKSSSWRSQVLR